MTAVTLTTFQVDVPTHVRSVELLGSWDNFHTPYPLTKDIARGHGQWRGCFKFTHIVCDGQTIDWNNPRSGLLKQGGRYWYYYRLDDREEFYDAAQPSTHDCPLLPGQCLNMLDVPTELGLETYTGPDGAIMFTPANAIYMTLDPEDRYRKLRKVKSSIMSRPRSLLNLLRPRSSAQTHSAAVDNPSAHHVEPLPGDAEPVTNDVWPLNCATATPTVLESGVIVTEDIDRPLPAPAERQVRLRPSLRRMASGFLRRRDRSHSVGSGKALPLPSDATVPPVPALPNVSVGAALKSGSLTAITPAPADRTPTTSEKAPEDTRHRLRRTTSVRNFARPFQSLSRSTTGDKAIALNRSKSHAVLASHQQTTQPAFDLQTLLEPQSSPSSSSASDSPVAMSDMCSPSFSSSTLSAIGSSTPNRFSAQYAIANAAGSDADMEPSKKPAVGLFDVVDTQDHLRHGHEHIPRTWMADMVGSKQPSRPWARDSGHGDDAFSNSDDEDDDDNELYHSIHEPAADEERDDQDDEDNEERTKAIAALRATLLADETMISVNGDARLSMFDGGELDYLRSAIL